MEKVREKISSGSQQSRYRFFDMPFGLTSGERALFELDITVGQPVSRLTLAKLRPATDTIPSTQAAIHREKDEKENENKKEDEREYVQSKIPKNARK